MNHLEQLISEWYEFNGYFVRRNVRVGRLGHGGYEGELDIVAYHPEKDHLIHIESSIDAQRWADREKRFNKKFNAGKKYITKEIFPWLRKNHKLEQWTVIWASDRNHKTIGGGKVVPIWLFCQDIANDIIKRGKLESNTIPEQFPLLRTMQYTVHWADQIKKPDS